MRSKDIFLAVTAFLVVFALCMLLLVILGDQSGVFVTTDHVQNFPYSLLSEEAQEALK